MAPPNPVPAATTQAPSPVCSEGLCTITFPEPIVHVKQNDDVCGDRDALHDNYWLCDGPPPLRFDSQ